EMAEYAEKDAESPRGSAYSAISAYSAFYLSFQKSHTQRNKDLCFNSPAFIPLQLHLAAGFPRLLPLGAMAPAQA
ncbi:MAG: hypothetical protein ACREXT_14480, partial [Gammaproteobacteria bacterium]